MLLGRWKVRGPMVNNHRFETSSVRECNRYISRYSEILCDILKGTHRLYTLNPTVVAPRSSRKVIWRGVIR
jgi:hypothetical protein